MATRDRIIPSNTRTFQVLQAKQLPCRYVLLWGLSSDDLCKCFEDLYKMVESELDAIDEWLKYVPGIRAKVHEFAR